MSTAGTIHGSKPTRDPEVLIPMISFLDLLEQVARARNLAEACRQLAMVEAVDLTAVDTVGQEAVSALELLRETLDELHVTALGEGGTI